MYNVLVVDDDRIALEIFEERLKRYGDFFNPIYASNGEDAVEILTEHDISLLVTDLVMPGELDGWALIDYVEENHHNLPIIVITSCEEDDKIEDLQTRVRHVLKKPVKITQLVQNVTDILNEDLTSGSLNGVSIASFLQLLEIEGKTCLLEVAVSATDKGLLYINKGRLYDALYGDFEALEAACRLIALDNARFHIKPLPKKKIRQTIKAELMSILMDAMLLKDDKAADQNENDKEDTENIFAQEDDSETSDISAEDTVADQNKYDKEDTENIFAQKDDNETSDMSAEDTVADQNKHDKEDIENIFAQEDDNETSDMSENISEKAAEEEPNNDQVGESISPLKEKEKDVMALETILEELRGINGYKAAALMNYTGEILAADSVDASTDLGNVGAVFNDIFRSSHEAAGKVGLQVCNELTMRTPNGLIIMACSGVDAPVHFHLIAVLSKDGNQALAKMQLDKMIPIFMKELS